jgi:hypothetical protein
MSFHQIARLFAVGMAASLLWVLCPPIEAQSAAGESAAARAPVNLATTPPEELLKVYAQLQNLEGGRQYALTENAVRVRLLLLAALRRPLWCFSGTSAVHFPCKFYLRSTSLLPHPGDNALKIR